MQSLRDLEQAGRRLLLVYHAHAALTQTPSAPDVARMTFDTLVALGLGGPARELLSLRADVAATPEEREALSAAAQRAPHGRVAWAARRDCFETNVARLAARCPQLAERARQASAALAEWQLFQTMDGAMLLSQRQPGGLRRWSPVFCQQQEPFPGLPPTDKTGAFAVLGVRPGELLERIVALTEPTLLNMSFPVYLLEPDVVRLAAWLHCGDLPWLALPRVQCFAGPDAAHALRDLLLRDEYQMLPGYIVNLTLENDRFEALRGIVMHLDQHRRGETERLSQALQQRGAARDAAYWARRWRGPRRAMAITSRFTSMLQYSTRDAAAACARLGVPMEVLLEHEDHCRGSALTILRAIDALDPDLILSLDHLRYEHPDLPQRIPFLCWTQDPMPKLLCREAGASLGELDFVCGFYGPRCVAEFGYPEAQFLSVKIPVCADRFHDEPLSPETAARTQADICFVSHASRTMQQLCADQLRLYHPALHPLLDRIAGAIIEIVESDGSLDLQTSCRALVLEQMQRGGVRMSHQHVEILVSNFAYKLFDWGRRQRTLQWVANWAQRTGRVLRIYGRGWEQHPTLAPFACGVLEHGEALRCAYRGSRLALQLMPAGFLHQRSFEAIISGALPLARYCPDSDDFGGLDRATFEQRRAAGQPVVGAAAIMPDFPRIVFDSAAEFEQRAEQLLGDDAERARILERMRAVVLRDFTYDAVMQRVLGAFAAQLDRFSTSAPMSATSAGAALVSA